MARKWPSAKGPVRMLKQQEWRDEEVIAAVRSFHIVGMAPSTFAPIVCGVYGRCQLRT